MERGQRQRQMLDRYTEEMKPAIGKPPISSDQPFVEFWRAFKAAIVIFQIRPEIRYPQFRTDMKDAIRVIDALSRKAAKRSIEAGVAEVISKETEAHRYFGHAAQLRIKFNDIPDSYEAQIKIGNLVRKNIPHTIKRYTIRPGIFRHPESPISIQIEDPSGKVLGTVGGVAHVFGGVPVFRINNMQGIRPANLRDASKHDNRTHAAGFARMDRALGENWGEYLIKKLHDILSEAGVRVVGDPPAFYESQITKKEYLNIHAKYTKAYANAGIKFSGRKPINGDILLIA